jgi:hypothetical protein
MARTRRNDDLHTRIFDVLLEKVRSDPFPSSTHLDMLEAMVRDEDEAEQYTSALIDKVGQETYPSLDHLRRLQGFA